jgi:transcriptional regulator with XRE-family HTH domain
VSGVELNREALRALRLAGGDSQETLAARAGLSETALNQLETGRTKSARISTIRKLAVALSCPIGAITRPSEPASAPAPDQVAV